MGDTALAEQKGSVSVLHQGSHITTLTREEQVWLENNPTLGEKAGTDRGSLHVLPWLLFAVSHRTPVWAQRVVMPVRGHGSWRARCGLCGPLSDRSRTEPEEEEGPAPDKRRTEPRSASSCSHWP